MSQRRIDTVVRIRRLQEQLASAGVARARQDVVLADHAEQAAWQLVADRATIAPSRADALRDTRAMLAGGIAHATTRRHLTVAATHHAELALDDWRVAMQRLDGIERLNDRLVTAERAEEQRREGVELDDLVVMRWKRAS